MQPTDQSVLEQYAVKEIHMVFGGLGYVLIHRMASRFVIVFSVVSIFILTQYLLFLVVPRMLDKRGAKKRQSTIRILRILDTLPTLGGDGAKMVLLIVLGHHSYYDRQYSEAINIYRRALVCKIPTPLEASLRKSLSDALEAYGHKDEANEERQVAYNQSLTVPQTALTCLTQGKIKAQEQNYRSAIALFEEALSRTTPNLKDERLEIVLQLMLANSRATVPYQTINWADEAIMLGAKGATLGVIHKQARDAHLNLGDLGKAHDHAVKAYEFVKDSGSSAEQSQSLASIASIIAYQGSIQDALATLSQAISLAPKNCRSAYLFQAMFFKVQGQYEAAKTALQNYQECAQPANSKAAKTNEAIGLASLASLYAEIGDGTASKTYLDQAVDNFAGNEKMLSLCEYLSAWSLALLGEKNAARMVILKNELMPPDESQNPGSHRDRVFYLMCAATALPDGTLGLRLVQHYLELNPYPIYRQKAYYLLGECRRCRGEPGAAREAYQQAVAFGCDTHSSRLSEARLREAF